jgi:hypothetical protein
MVDRPQYNAQELKVVIPRVIPELGVGPKQIRQPLGLHKEYPYGLVG